MGPYGADPAGKRIRLHSLSSGTRGYHVDLGKNISRAGISRPPPGPPCYAGLTGESEYRS